MDSESELGLISKGLYQVVDRIIGNETFIKIRRTIRDLRDKYEFIISDVKGEWWNFVYSGSRAEGFRFRSSDDDWMLISKDTKVITDMSFAHAYSEGTTVLLMDNEINKPGFTFLKFISGP